MEAHLRCARCDRPNAAHGTPGCHAHLYSPEPVTTSMRDWIEMNQARAAALADCTNHLKRTAS